jgi:hypothetical protein
VRRAFGPPIAVPELIFPASMNRAAIIPQHTYGDKRLGVRRVERRCLAGPQ